MAAATTGISKKKASGRKKASDPDAMIRGNKKGANVELSEEDLKKVSGGGMGMGKQKI